MNRTLFASFLVLSVAAGVYAQSEFAPQTMLKPRTTVIYSIPPNVDARTGYDLLGTRSGINMVYVSSFKPDTPVPLRIEGRTFFEAMDKFSAETGNFWFAWDSKTVVVAPDNQAMRRSFEPLTFKLFYLDTSTRDEDVANIANGIRTALQLRGADGFFSEADSTKRRKDRLRHPGHRG